MTPLALIFVIINALALFFLPRRWAPLPLIIGACYMTLGQRIELGPFSLHAIRLLIAAGGLRVVCRGERVSGGLNTLDWVMIGWAGWAVFSSIFHSRTSEGNPLILRLGLAYNTLGIYFLFRIFITTIDELVQLLKFIPILLAPLAFEMLIETLTKKNLFAVFGRVSEAVIVRGDRSRAQGPFAHPILAGTVGAVCFPMMIGLYKNFFRLALLGGCVSLIMVVASGSSGPLMSLMFSMCVLFFWRWRAWTNALRIAMIVGYMVLDIVMQAPAYYLIARVDLTGSSTGWHRARLIESGLAHLNEWWLAGTDYTRHWMPTGVTWSAEHTDITNHFLQYGVIGGLPLIFLFLGALFIAFCYIGESLKSEADEVIGYEFILWGLGASLATHAVTCLSVAYFDQSYIFIFMTLALIGTLKSQIALSENLDVDNHSGGEAVLNSSVENRSAIHV